MKKLFLLLTMSVLLFSCSKEESMDSIEKETKTITPAVGYESPYDLNIINPTFPIKFINNSAYPVNYRLATIVGFYDGNWDGVIDYTAYGGPLITSTNAPTILGSGNELYVTNWAHSISSPPGSVVDTDISSFSFGSQPFNLTELNFLKTYSKLLFLHTLVGDRSFKLKHDVPPPFTNMNSIPPIMSSNGYNIIPGVSAFNFTTNQLMGIISYNNDSREVIWPEMPGFESEYYFSYSGTLLHLYFKTYSDHIEIVLE